MNGLKIALVNPHDRTVPSEYFGACENLALAYLTAYLRKEGFEVEIFDGDAEKIKNNEVIEKVTASGAKLIGITSLSRTINDALRIALGIKRKKPDVHVCMGGQHVTYIAEEILSKHHYIDSIVRGEGEITFLELSKSILQGKKLLKIDGLYSRTPPGNIIRNKDRRAIKYLDQLPFPARDTLEKLINKGQKPILSILSSRGCIGQCTFCNASDYFKLGGGASWRSRSAKNVVDELETLCKKYGGSSFDRVVHFYDDNFIGPGKMGRKRAREIAEEIIRRGLDINFFIFCRVDGFGSETGLIQLLKKAGLTTTFIGIESSMESELQLFQKGTTIEQNIETVKLLERNNILIPASGFIMFHPYSTFENLRANANFLHRINQASFWNLSVKLIAYKGNKIVDRIRDDGLLLGTIAEGGIYEYDFLDAKVGAAANAMDFSTHPVMLKADAVIRYVQFMKNFIAGKLEETDIYQNQLTKIDDEIRNIFEICYRFFMDSLDLAEQGWREEIFNMEKSKFLKKIDFLIENLEAVFGNLLKDIFEKMSDKDDGL